MTPVDGHSPRLFLDHCTRFRHRLHVFPRFECPCNVLQTFCAVGGTREGRRVRGEGVAGFRCNSKPAEDIVPNVWTCVPLRSRLLLPFSMHVCPLKVLF